MPHTIARASLLDNLRFNLFYVVPYVLQGVFLRNRFWVGVFSRLHRDALGVRFGRKLRRKYRSGYVRLRMLASPSVLVTDAEGIRRVLEQSPAVYVEPRSKRRGMAHFQPGALNISRGKEWENRRRFNVAVLDPNPNQPHPFAPRFLAVAREEVSQLQDRVELSWRDFEELFRALTVRVLFGDVARDDHALTAALDRLMRRANRPFLPRRARDFAVLYERIQHYLDQAEPETLASLCGQVPADVTTRVANQVPHWLFAAKDTLAMNVVFALGLIASRRGVEQRVRAELGQWPVLDAAALHQCRYLEGCIQEAMRLWPTTPFLVREAICADHMAGAAISPGTQVIIWNSFTHRDPASSPRPDLFQPERWQGNAGDYRFNHLSNGPQVCAGKSLALFLGRTVLAELLADGSYKLRRPRLPETGPLPESFNPFRVSFARRPVPGQR